MRQPPKGKKGPPKNQKKLSWSQKAYDWNRDGKLSTLEWGSWYWNMYGENEERRKREARRRRQEQEADQTVPVSASISSVRVSFYVDLTKTWNDLKAALRVLARPHDDVLLPLLSKAVLHEISAGIWQLAKKPEPQRMQELKDFLGGTPDLHLEDNPETLFKNASSGILYPQEAELSVQFCGAFWNGILHSLPSAQYYHNEPESLSDLLSGLSSLYTYFAGTDGETADDSDRRNEERCNELRNAFYHHWRDKALLHPNVERAKNLLSRGELPDGEDICRDILTAEYPEEAASYSLDELNDTCWYIFLDRVFLRDASKAIRMWRTLLDIAAPCLKSNKDVSKELLHDWTVLGSLTADAGEALFDALSDDTFARQIFQSAYLGALQQDILSACHEFGQMRLSRHCLGLALKNRHLTENRESQLRDALSISKASTPAQRRSSPQDKIPDDGTVFHYCTVRLQGVCRPYAYLTGDLSLKVGDWVEVPFGKEDTIRRGQIGSITDCTRLAAPWPPEQTKAVVRILSQQSAEPAECKKGQPERTVEEVIILKSKTGCAAPKTGSPVTESAALKKDGEKPASQKKSFPFGKLIAAVLAVAVIIAIALAASHN